MTLLYKNLFWVHYPNPPKCGSPFTSTHHFESRSPCLVFEGALRSKKKLNSTSQHILLRIIKMGSNYLLHLAYKRFDGLCLYYSTSKFRLHYLYPLAILSYDQQISISQPFRWKTFFIKRRLYKVKNISHVFNICQDKTIKCSVIIASPKVV